MESTYSHQPAMTTGSWSLANPGSMPDVSHEVPPARQASCSLATMAWSPVAGKVSGTMEVEITFLPDSRMAHMSASASWGRMSPEAL